MLLQKKRVLKKKCYLASEDDDDNDTFSHKTKVKNTPGIIRISGWPPSPKKSKYELNLFFLNS
jgi:hypothetical protein